MLASLSCCRLVLPKGSLERATLDLFEAADLAVQRFSDVDYRATIDDPRVDEVRILRPAGDPGYVADGLFDLGITGRDWIEETESKVTTLGELRSARPPIGPSKSCWPSPRTRRCRSPTAKLPGVVRVSTEYPELTRRYLEDAGVKADVRFSYGATEAKVPDIADAVVDITETGSALRAAGLRIIETILVSSTELIANPLSLKPTRTSSTPCSSCSRCSRAPLKPGAGCWSSSTCRAPRSRRDRPVAVDEVADRLAAVRRRRLRGRGGRAEGTHQHAHPRPQGPRRDRHHRVGAVQDRALTHAPAMRPSGWSGTVVDFDEAVGLGDIEAGEAGDAGEAAGAGQTGGGAGSRRFPFPLHANRRRLPHGGRRRSGQLRVAGGSGGAMGGRRRAAGDGIRPTSQPTLTDFDI